MLVFQFEESATVSLSLKQVSVQKHQCQQMSDAGSWPMHIASLAVHCEDCTMETCIWPHHIIAILEMTQVGDYSVILSLKMWIFVLTWIPDYGVPWEGQGYEGYCRNCCHMTYSFSGKLGHATLKWRLSLGRETIQTVAELALWEERYFNVLFFARPEWKDSKYSGKEW